MIGVRNDLAEKIKINFPVPYAYKPVLRDILRNVPASDGAEYSEYKRKIFEWVPPGGYWRDIPPDIAKEYMNMLEYGWRQNGHIEALID